MNKSLTIGRLSQAAEVNIETIRYYQRFGLITEPERPSAGYRVYPSEYIARLRFIKHAKNLGFSLKEIAELLQLGDGRCDDVRTRAEQKRVQIEQQINDLQKLHNTLNALIDACHTDHDAGHCPIIETLTA